MNASKEEIEKVIMDLEIQKDSIDNRIEYLKYHHIENDNPEIIRLNNKIVEIEKAIDTVKKVLLWGFTA